MGTVRASLQGDVGINDPFSSPNQDPWLIYHHNKDFALARYNPNGALDTTTFGTLGKVTTDFAGSLDNEGHGVAIQPLDGKIVVAGYNDAHNFVLARYTGTLKFVYLPFISR